MIYGYARCSTDETKQNIDRQVRELRSQGVPKENIYLEYQSGVKIDRVQLNRLLDTISCGDTLITTEVSRITRSTKQLLEILEISKEKKLKLILGSFIVDFTEEEDPMSIAMIQIMGVFSELERNMISHRVKSGISNARAKGKRIGRPKLKSEDLPKLFIKHYSKYTSEEINIKELSALCGLSRPTVYKYINIIEDKNLL